MEVTRRRFIQGLATTGVGMLLPRTNLAAGRGDQIIVALIGAGTQGRNLVTSSGDTHQWH